MASIEFKNTSVLEALGATASIDSYHDNHSPMPQNGGQQDNTLLYGATTPISGGIPYIQKRYKMSPSKDIHQQRIYSYS